MSLLTSRIWAFKQTVHAIVTQKMLFGLAVALAGLALTIPFFLVSMALSMSGDIFNMPTQTEVTIFTDRTASDKTVRALADNIAKNPLFRSVRIMPKKEALESVNASLGLRSAKTSSNPLPDILIATVATNVTSEELAACASELKKLKGIDSVAYDNQWAKYLVALTSASTIVLSLFGVIVGLLVLLVIFASVRLTTAAQKDEIRALYLFGATPAFIKRPYLWRGALTLTLAALISMGLTHLGLGLLSKPLADFASLYGVSVALRLPSYDWCILYVGGAALLGWIVGMMAASDALKRVSVTGV